MFSGKEISYPKKLAVICIFVCSFSIYCITVPDFLLTYTAFFLSFVFLVATYSLTNRSQLFKLLFFFIPLSVSVDITGDSQIQMPTEIIIGLMACILFFSVNWYSFFSELLNKNKAIHLSSLQNKEGVNVNESMMQPGFWKNPVTILLMAEVGWMLVCSSVSELKPVSFKYTMVRLSYLAVFYFLAYQWLEKNSSPYSLFLLYASGLILPVFNGILFHARYNFSQATAYIMPKPFYNDHTVYGACIAFILPVLVGMLLTRIYFSRALPGGFVLILLILLLLVAEYFSFSRAAWLSLATALLLILYIKTGLSAKLFVMIIIAMAVTVFVNWELIISRFSENKAVSNKNDLEQQIKSITNVATDVSNTERINRWKSALRMGMEKPVFGFGPRTYKFFYGQYQVKEEMTRTSTYHGNKGHAHSDYLSYFAEGGLVGFLLHVCLYMTVLYKGINLARKCRFMKNRIATISILSGVSTYMVHGIFNGFMEEEKMASLVFLGFATLVFIEQKEKVNESVN